MKTRLAPVVWAPALVVAACSGDAAPTTSSTTGAGSTTATTSGSVSETQAPSTTVSGPSATATLIVGDESWTFDNVFCFSNTDPGSNAMVVGEDGLVIGGATDGLDLYVSIIPTPTVGEVHGVELSGNSGETVWFADDRLGEMGPNPEGFIVVDDRTVAADAMFFQSEDQLTVSPDTGTPGRFEANCG